MKFDQYIENYVKEQFLNHRDPMRPGYVPTVEDWNAMPDEAKKFPIDLIKGLPVLKELVKLYEQKHTDYAFGMMMKDAMKKALK